MPLRNRDRRKDAAPASADGPDANPAEAADAPAADSPAPPAESVPPGASEAASPEATEPVGRRPVALWGPVLLARTAHPKQAVVTALGVTAAAALADRPTRELALVLGTVLVGQVMVGWHHDLVDRERDRRAGQAGRPDRVAGRSPAKPLADGGLDPGTVWFAFACATLLVVPLSLSSGLVAGSAYLIAVAVSLAGNLVLRRGWLSWLPWAASFALYPAYLSYGGWGGDHLGSPPEVWVTVLAGALGVCVHFLRALPGLVADNRDGYRHLPLRVALRIGAPALLWSSLVATGAVLAALATVASRVGLSQ